MRNYIEIWTSGKKESESVVAALPMLWATLILVSLGLFAGSLMFGELNQDEGWYLYAARLTSEGHMPYVDFATTQGPAMYYIYALANPLVTALGVAGGRLFTALLGFATVASASWLAYRLAAPSRKQVAAFFTFALLGANAYQVYYTTIVKTYALTGLLLVLGFVAMSYAIQHRHDHTAFLAGILMGLAAATRTSAAFALPVVVISLFVYRMKSGVTREDLSRSIPVWFACGAALTLCLLFVPFIVRAPQGIWFAFFEYHAGRETGSFFMSLLRKGGSMCHLVRAYPIVLGLSVIFGLEWLVKKLDSEQKAAQLDLGSKVELAAVILSACVVGAVHLAAPFPYDEYQVMIMPLVVVAVSVFLVGLIQKNSLLNILTLSLVILSVAGVMSSSMVEKWVLRDIDRIWVVSREKTPLGKLREVAGFVREIAGEDGEILTQDAYLAVESKLRLPHGLEMGPFSYYPDWSTEKATARHVLNKEMMLELITNTKAPVIALSGYSFTISSPSVTELSEEEQYELRGALGRRYKLIKTVEHFGQAGTELEIYGRMPVK
ncbi:hypothetical protein BVX94_03835 [bacterium B17]|nr:hypothetical protein BVX94_03835 [bacterium B17]